MKKSSLIVVMVLAVFSTGLFAYVRVAGHDLSSEGYYLADRGLGVGIVVGSGAELSIKDGVILENALQFDMGWDLTSSNFGIVAAYLIHNFKIIEASDMKIPLYFGIKGWANVGSDLLAGIQVPLGIDWIFKTAPIDIFLQIEPGIEVIPHTIFAGNAGLGVRYWFR